MKDLRFSFGLTLTNSPFLTVVYYLIFELKINTDIFNYIKLVISLDRRTLYMKTNV